ncbi:MAG: ImmA/IrrE family metallo-endopeptidase [Nocardiopsaceae bacterium]|nr:ImmA/IrrE family metallo-endopeptidase [Nocardiopsaceae bacterium]
MHPRQPRSRCETTIQALTIPVPLGLEPFRECLERHRGRPVDLIPTTTANGCSGLWIGTRDADYIFYERDTTPLHQLHIVAHEAGHMLLGHAGTPIGTEQLARLLFPDLPAALVQSALGRSAYTDAEEHEAETFASLLLGPAAHHPPTPPNLPPGTAAFLDRLEDAFTAHPRHHGTLVKEQGR